MGTGFKDPLAHLPLDASGPTLSWKFPTGHLEWHAPLAPECQPHWRPTTPIVERPFEERPRPLAFDEMPDMNASSVVRVARQWNRVAWRDAEGRIWTFNWMLPWPDGELWCSVSPDDPRGDHYKPAMEHALRMALGVVLRASWPTLK